MLLLDGHVHIYPCFDLGSLFDGAVQNFQVQARRLGAGDSYSGILLLTERPGENRFSTLSGAVSEQGGPCPGAVKWRLSATAERQSLALTGRNDAKIFLIAGRQVVSREGLEVLALLTAAEFEDGGSVSAVVRQITDAGGVPVIPWAFGKWFGSRGRILRELVQRDGRDFFLGDNGGRPVCYPVPGLLRHEMEQGRPVISGSDPLPIKGEEKRAGSFGVYADIGLDDRRPAGSLKKLMSDPVSPFAGYGNPLPFLRFVRNQWLLRRGCNG